MGDGGDDARERGRVGVDGADGGEERVEEGEQARGGDPQGVDPGAGRGGRGRERSAGKGEESSRAVWIGDVRERGEVGGGKGAIGEA